MENQNDDKGVDEKEIKLGRHDVRFPPPLAYERYSAELQRRGKGQPQDNEIAKAEDNFIARILHFVRID